ncbi:hypothetical protein AMECASPLE_038246 [Ameca splendens]|uniref:Uncharacterized protein n=1 Tax=Ameca splendens TaxID=208324 RepID=A0ABV0ZUH5_9TELE
MFLVDSIFFSSLSDSGFLHSLEKYKFDFQYFPGLDEYGNENKSMADICTSRLNFSLSKCCPSFHPSFCVPFPPPCISHVPLSFIPSFQFSFSVSFLPTNSHSYFVYFLLTLFPFFLS